MDSLPVELRQHIFGYLDIKSLLQAASTCKNWRVFILTSKILMKYLSFFMTDYEAQKDFLVKYGCGLSKICIFKRTSNNPKSNFKNFKLFLQSISQVEELCIFSLKPPTVPKRLDNNDLRLPNLKKLTLWNNGNNSRIFEFLHGCKPVEFTSSITKHHHGIKYFSEPFWNWLNLQVKMTTINLQEDAIAEFFKSTNDVKIKLKNLSFYRIDSQVTASNIMNIIEFLKQQNELEEIKINQVSENEHIKKVLHHIFFNIKSLKFLILSSLPAGLFGENVKDVNLDLERLECYENINTFCYFFPNIKSLYLHRLYGSQEEYDFQFIANSLTELETLKLENCNSIGNLSSAKFEKLINIELYKCMFDLNDWIVLTTHAPLIEKLVIDEFKLSNDCARTFVNWKNLKHLVFLCGFYQDGLTDVFCECSALKHLTMSISMKDHFWDVLRTSDFDIKILANIRRYRGRSTQQYPEFHSNKEDFDAN